MIKKAFKQQHIASLLELKTNNDIVAPLWFQYRHDPALSMYPSHGHAWGEFVYAYDGMMQINIGEQQLITPPHYGIWLPPYLEHSGMNRTDVKHGTLYVHEQLCTKVSDQAGILLITTLVSALFEHLKSEHLKLEHLKSESESQLAHSKIDPDAHLRVLQVILDQLAQATHIGSYLPSTAHPALKILLDYLHDHPADNSSLKRLAERINMTERTLARHSQSELGMSIHEWRQRLKVMKAMNMLSEQKSVENIAFDLGYASTSAFISMFKRWMNTTPDQFRKQYQ